MPTTTTAPSPRRRKAAETLKDQGPFFPLSRGRRRRRFIPVASLAAASLLLAAAPAHARPEVMLMTGLPLVWGEKGPFEAGSAPAAAYSELSAQFRFRPVDVLDEASLSGGRLLFLAQPQRLAPAELAALDRWVRGGGRALILTDPSLAWPSALPVGDIRRPPPVGLLAPLLGHWGLTVEPPARAGEVEADWGGKRVRLDSPGRLRGTGPGCVVETGGWTARCRLGRGTARVVADADLLSDSLWRAADNREAVGAWLHELAGTSPPSSGPSLPTLAAIALALLVLLAAAGLLSRRLRRR